RSDYRAALPSGFRGMLAVERAVHESALEPPLLELVKMRAPQINGCAYCLDMHSKGARARGEDEQRLHVLSQVTGVPAQSPDRLENGLPLIPRQPASRAPASSA